MRVAIDCRYLRGRPSGIGAYVRALVDRLPGGDGSEYVLWTHRRAERPLSRAPNVREVLVAGGPTAPAALLWPGLHASFRGIDVFHNPHNVLPRGVPCRSVVTVHDILALDSPRLHRRGVERIRGLYYPQAVMRALTRATRIVVPTAATADRVIAWVPDALPRVRVVPMAAGPLFQPGAEPAARASAAALAGADRPFALIVGENTIHKNHAIALQAFAAGAPPSWRLVLVHRLGSPGRLRRLAERLGIAERTTWLHGIDDRRVASLLQLAVVLIHPSRYEGFGLPVLEAMACGCPVVASDIPPLREVAGGAALLAPPDDVEAFASALDRLAQSEALRRDLIGAGLERAARFSWDRTACETFAVYGEAAGA